MNAERFHILVVEDDDVTRAKLTSYLEVAGYRVTEVADGKAMQRVLLADMPDLLLLDINLPGEDGLELTRRIRRRSDIGIIFVSGRTDEVDRIVGLEMGADDYVTKPFNPREVMARVKNLLRRTRRSSGEQQEVRRFTGWQFDMRTRTVTSNDGHKTSLTRAEFELLCAFTDHPGTVMARERLLNHVTHRVETPNDRTVDVLVRRLRRKLEKDPKQPELFITAHGEGYIFAGDPA